MTETEALHCLFRQLAIDNCSESYKQLFVRMQPSLVRFAFGILKSEALAFEVVSDVFIRIWEKRDTLQHVDSPRSYLYQAVKNEAINALHQQERRQLHDALVWAVPAESVFFNPEQQLISKETLAALQRAVQELPPKCRTIFKLVKEDGLKYREVAALLDLSVKTVEAQMGIAIKRLASCMQLQLPARQAGAKAVAKK
ncbi:MAG: RNA polymerase sigma-70 factor [Chitinophagaceae bacterium]|jgi:RNA polymerase sigma-70 factor (ECF subfamily)|nr:RNA polymerase sigma-70 factor [Chitinophagaceae bacterium]